MRRPPRAAQSPAGASGRPPRPAESASLCLPSSSVRRCECECTCMWTSASAAAFPLSPAPKKEARASFLKQISWEQMDQRTYVCMYHGGIDVKGLRSKDSRRFIDSSHFTSPLPYQVGPQVDEPGHEGSEECGVVQRRDVVRHLRTMERVRGQLDGAQTHQILHHSQ